MPAMHTTVTVWGLSSDLAHSTAHVTAAALHSNGEAALVHGCICHHAALKGSSYIRLIVFYVWIQWQPPWWVTQNKLGKGKTIILPYQAQNNPKAVTPAAAPAPSAAVPHLLPACCPAAA
jgi:hypothetical protein